MHVPGVPPLRQAALQLAVLRGRRLWRGLIADRPRWGLRDGAGGCLGHGGRRTIDNQQAKDTPCGGNLKGIAEGLHQNPLRRHVVS
jgi:hypothetical protein